MTKTMARMIFFVHVAAAKLPKFQKLNLSAGHLLKYKSKNL
jgi:hypothetical protein